MVLADLVCDRRVRKIPRRMSGRRYAVTPYAPPYAVADAVYNLERQRDGLSAAGRRREHIGGASSVDRRRCYAVR